MIDGSNSLAAGRRLALGLCAAAVLAAPLPALAQEQSLTIIRDAEVEEILHRQSDPIFRAAGLEPKAVQIILIGDKELNAFTSSGGGAVIGLNTGMIIAAKTPGELAGVIAHETGHAAGGHIARSDVGTGGALRTMLITMGLGVIAALAGAPDAGGALVASSGYFATLDMLGYTREQEGRADQAAATYLDKAGQSGAGLVSFFNQFRYQELFDNSKRYPYFRSHPLGSERIDALRLRVERLPNYKVADPPEALEQHKLMVAKLKAFINYPQQTLQDYPETDTSFAARYARAIAHYKATETERSLKDIDALIADYPANPYLQELKGQVLFETGRSADAEAPYRKALELKPDQPLLRMALGQTLVAQNDKAKLDEAVLLLRRVAAEDRDNALVWRMLAQAYDARGEAGLARLATAEEKFTSGQKTEARVFGMRAREQLPKNSPEWRRATDIVLVSEPTKDDLKMLSQEGSAPPAR
ncbi:MAG TPA: M48 family metalloprotease [Caulobacteraceae bacterium]|jgi:predicted Zn-dependent protease